MGYRRTPRSLAAPITFHRCAAMRLVAASHPDILAIPCLRQHLWIEASVAGARMDSDSTGC